jgi:hypothetical protein
MRLRCLKFLLGLEMLKFFVIDSKSLLLYLVKNFYIFNLVKFMALHKNSKTPSIFVLLLDPDP